MTLAELKAWIDQKLEENPHWADDKVLMWVKVDLEYGREGWHTFGGQFKGEWQEGRGELVLELDDERY